eukprot:TRINITY_DN2050_c0_g1_i1.p1 TRINITY_DN2050_c0_g1~~TRINITY_DN2050_c0_g1_i1.p1  ORF type:complete len:375 (-),score=82.59 TRINITY_DN2050_c0_g1_i1:156-1280(-)
MEDERQQQLRKAIREIQTNASLTQGEKSRRIQLLMSGKPIVSENEKMPSLKRKPVEELDMEITYNKPGILGCKHYKRGCKIRAFCCGQLFGCRWCHDEMVKDHKINRHETEEMFCMHCNKLQPIAQFCGNQDCGHKLGHYYCDICKFHENDEDKRIYHCSECGICRVGQGLGIDFFHCKTCAMCLSKDMEGKHKCIENNMKSDCTICNMDLFTSRHTATLLPCGHAIHSNCRKDYLLSGNYTCPLCFKSIVEIDWSEQDQLLAAQPMPPEFANAKANILCNDCGTKGEVPFHFVGHKCANCGSYNTKKISTTGMPDMMTQNLVFQAMNERLRQEIENRGDRVVEEDDDEEEEGEEPQEQQNEQSQPPASDQNQQ